MAFNLEDRFSRPPKCFTLLDPGAYESYFKIKPKINTNKVPFLSNTPRNTQSNKIWTHNIYFADYPPKIPNCTSLMSKKPRFPYELFSQKDLHELLCRCGIEQSCECSTKNEEVQCQGKVRKCLFKGHPPRLERVESLSSPDHDKYKDEGPPFYDTNINELTSFYQGCKWSKWTSSRSVKVLDTSPGPAHYNITREPTTEEICAERHRSYKRQTSKQLRFIEMVQKRNILEDRPGPASYNIELPKGTELKYVGSKGDRFPNKQYEQQPGPTHYLIRRDFDPIQFNGYTCHAKLPKPSCFGVKALRFRRKKEEGPSPASYYPRDRTCHFLRCSKAPFSTSAERFKSVITEDSDGEEEVENKVITNVDNESGELYIMPTWEFRSKTVRMKKNIKRLDEPSPADLPQTRIQIKRQRRLQYLAPFFSSDGRFQPWYNWMSIHGKLNTPGPCSYSLEKPKCYPAVYRGPIFRAERFHYDKCKNPAPNEYRVVEGNVETILRTHNKRLKDNIKNRPKFIWKQPEEKRELSFEEQENLLLNRSIVLLDIENTEIIKPGNNKNNEFDETKKPKLLRCFLYKKQMPIF